MEKYQTIIIVMQSDVAVWRKDTWDGYLYDGKFFIVKKDGVSIGFYNLDKVVSIIVN